MENCGQWWCSHHQNRARVLHHHTLIPTGVLSLLLCDPVWEEGTSDVPSQCCACSSSLPCEEEEGLPLAGRAQLLGRWWWCCALLGTVSPSLLPSADSNCKWSLGGWACPVTSVGLTQVKCLPRLHCTDFPPLPIRGEGLCCSRDAPGGPCWVEAVGTGLREGLHVMAPTWCAGAPASSQGQSALARAWTEHGPAEKHS